MSREIKFRAFDKINKRIVKVESIDFINNQLHFLSETFKGNPTFITDYELMQYTGLKDKNGVEIYECDIIKCFGDIADVYYDEENALFRYRYKNGNEIYMEILGTHSYEYFVVIGNIYENTELLEN